MLSLREQIVEQLNQVPETRLQEVLAFVRFMVRPGQEVAQISTTPRLAHLAQEIDTFFQEPPSRDACHALDELGTGIFENNENMARNHDAFLYGAPRRDASS